MNAVYYLVLFFLFSQFCDVILIQKLDISVEKNLYERQNKVKDEPEVNHLYISCFWEAIWHTDEQGDQH